MNPKDWQVRKMPAPLGDRLPEGASTQQIADTIAAIWREIEESLHPIIGHRSVAALYNRSLKLTAADHPWLAPAYRDALAALDPPALKAALVQQTPTVAAAGGRALFQSFHDLLVSLVGTSLTHRLLRTVLEHPSNAASAQDTTT